VGITIVVISSCTLATYSSLKDLTAIIRKLFSCR